MICEKRLPLLKKTVLRKYIDSKRGYFFCKRILDVLFATAIILTVLSWVLPLLALLIKLSSKGPVFFLQKRTGRGGRSFTCYKLRTLAHNPVAHTKRVDIGEETTTPLGLFLRQSNLDELPQFFNVLAGSMSLVGPRPHMHADCNEFAALIPRYKFRNLVKPGITGLAQVKGYHGKVISLECIYKRYEWDVWYVQYASFWLDIRIIANTTWQTGLAVLGLRKKKQPTPIIIMANIQPKNKHRKREKVQIPESPKSY
ncbi:MULTISPECIES: sugar transferase [Niastella]|uniref:Sugar transferase n=1 Tax=Niastella soli TaxID=2821487 RepID=A0ABS3YY58_9BACT|nr:sugar transferase [Niastella soli]MBO9202764.1 sugar transferase [Niastella soli]